MQHLTAGAVKFDGSFRLGRHLLYGSSGRGHKLPPAFAGKMDLKVLFASGARF
ncbi:MAG: hypothetical protein AB1696_01445 [Planctomycetota bacterium]